MSEPALRIVAPPQRPAHLDQIKRRIIEGHDRLGKGHAEWVEGSLQIATALLEGRECMPADVSFSQWLKDNKLDFFHGHDRAALLKLATNLELAREVLSKAESRSYRLIWQQAKGRFDSAVKPHTEKPGRRKRQRKSASVLKINRAIKLGEDTIALIHGTSLDSSEEQDELIVLNRGMPHGELNDTVRKLVEDAVAGKAVSAIAMGAAIEKRAPLSANKLIDAFKKRMTFIWRQCDIEACEALIYYLIDDVEDRKRE
jgi:ribosomal protein L18E